jgi:hypothetical protein
VGFDREKYLSIGFSGVKQTDAKPLNKRERAPRGYPYVSSSLPRKGDPRCTHKGRFTKDFGKPIIENKSQEDRITGESNGRYRIV